MQEKLSSSTFILSQATNYLRPIEQASDLQIDKRLVRTFYDLFVAILTFRNSSMGLLLSELGAYICGPAHAPAGTKRISNLLRSKKCDSQIVDNEIFSRRQRRIEELASQGKRVLLLWDDSLIENQKVGF